MNRTERLGLDRPIDQVLSALAHVVHVEVRLNLAGLWEDMTMHVTRGECDRIIKKLRTASRNLDDMAGALRDIRRRLPAGPARETLPG